MADLQPTFSLTLGAGQATTAAAAGGPARFVVERDMDAAGDALRARLAEPVAAVLGDAVTLSLGHDGTEAAVFTGAVCALRPAVDGVEVWAVGGLHALLGVRVAAAFENQTAGAIARDLAGRANVATGTVEDGPSLPRYVADRRCSAHAHLQALAGRLGFELYADVDGRLMFHGLGAAAGLGAGGALGALAAMAPAAGGEGYAYGRHLLDVGADRRPAALAGVTVSGESPMSTQGDSTVAWLTTDPADYRGEAGDADGALVVDAVARTKDLADRFAAGVLAAGARSAHVVRATVLGRPALDLGDTVDVSGHPDATATGDGYVRALRHRFDGRQGFVTDLRVAVAA